jgi:hypothetical protein
MDCFKDGDFALSILSVANDLNAIPNLLDWECDKCRAQFSIVICSNKIKTKA